MRQTFLLWPQARFPLRRAELRSQGSVLASAQRAKRAVCGKTVPNRSSCGTGKRKCHVGNTTDISGGQVLAVADSHVVMIPCDEGLGQFHCLSEHLAVDQSRLFPDTSAGRVPTMI